VGVSAASGTGGALSPDGIPDALSGAHGVTVKGKRECEHGAVILEDRDNNIGETWLGDALMPSLDVHNHKHVKRVIPCDAQATNAQATSTTSHIPQFYLITFCLFMRFWYMMF